MKVRLIRKHADRIDGIDLSGRKVGDVLELPPAAAMLLVAEKWASPERRTESTNPTANARRVNERPQTLARQSR